MMRFGPILSMVLMSGAVSAGADGRVVRLEIERTRPVGGGATFG